MVSRARGPKADQSDEIKLDLLVDGVFITDKRLFLPEGRAEMYGGVAKCLLIRKGKEKILVDTGIGSVPDGPEFEPLRRTQKVTRTPSQGVALELSRVGVRPEEITTVINTHLHNAHCAGNKLFTNAHFYIAKDEFRFIDKLVGERPNQVDYVRPYFEDLPSLDEMNGEYQVTQEVRVVPTPGHTTGHQSVVISLPTGRKLVYSGDVAPLKENLVERIAMYGYDRALTITSMKKLLKVKNADWVFSHDNTQMTLAEAYAL